MGIHGIYKEIGPGQRIALSKLAVDKFEETGRPLRIAIDVSIWLFQIQASKGGTNPALRTFYYRLLRLISLSIHPVFVFDGPNKPPFKRNKRTGPNVASIPEFLAKQLLKQFGFPIHLAPGEAEAECALLQREGIVDAVLSEDVDTLMFGSRLTIRNWSPEQKSSKTPTHVNVYDAVETKSGAGLDREGMILVALMSGGDYVPEGIPGCGPKTACEAARAGFGRDLCNLAKNDTRALQKWRELLQHELRTNEHKYFKRKHGALNIPDHFPPLDILRYYTHPAISNRAGLDKLERSINWDQDLDFPGLRDFTHDAFDWVKLEGAKHFIRSLAPSLLVRHLRLRAEKTDRFPSNTIQAIQEDEATLVKGIHGKRQHIVTDHTTELRISFTPIELVKIDLAKEEPDDMPGAEDMYLQACPPTDADPEDELPLELEEDAAPSKRGPTKFDPEKSVRVWVLETYVKVGVPLKVQDWEAGLSRPKRAGASKEPKKTVSRPRVSRRAKVANDEPQANIERFAKVTKPGVRLAQALSKAQETLVNRQNSPELAENSRIAVIDLLSSSPNKPKPMVPAQLSREKSLSPVIEELPASVSKRRRRAPVQRSHTLPADINSRRPSTPPIDTIETLDLADLPPLPSPSHFPAKKAKTRERPNPPIARAVRGTSVVSSPGKSRQTTLDAWRATATPTPKKIRMVPSGESVLPIPSPPKFRPQPEIEILDLTLSSPPVNATTLLRTTTSTSRARPPLSSISSNISQEPSGSATTRSSNVQKGPKDAMHTRRTSPRLQKSKSTTPELTSLTSTRTRRSTRTQTVATTSFSGTEILDLSQFSPTSKPTPLPPGRLSLTSSEINTLDLTQSRSPAPPKPQRCVSNQDEPSDPTRTHISRLPTASPRPIATISTAEKSSKSPPAAWKSQAKKKREIILRRSLAGAWDFADAELVSSPSSGGGDGDGAIGASAVVPKGKQRRRWRESEVELLDLS